MDATMTADADIEQQVSENFSAARTAIFDAARDAKRSPDDVTLVAVSKVQ
ncbi:MAG TPA: YggS family pyridoxal phosphate-dependent enzyme, partial [Rhodospirillaceae bacterium]|nr:YggS family pyridoxal phosphate-dependent enzyme [Rhodospirillaceae bacterium]